MKKYIIFNSLAEADSLISKTNTTMGFPSGDGKTRTETYSRVVKNPNADEWAVKVCPNCFDLLSEAQLDSLVTLENFKALDWFPVPEWEA